MKILMTMMLDVDDKYVTKLESFIASLPQGAERLPKNINIGMLKAESGYS